MSLAGIPLGLSNGSIPFLLREKASYTAIGLFSLASYPYSLKLLWSPIVDRCDSHIDSWLDISNSLNISLEYF